MSLSNIPKRRVTDAYSNNWLLHSLSSFRDLKLERNNALLFTNYDNKLTIQVEQ